MSDYIEKMDNTNLSFLYHNAECLCTHYDKIEFILNELTYADSELLNKEYANLKKKRIYTSTVGDCFLELNSLKYEPTSEPTTEEKISAIREMLHDFPDTEDLIFNVGQLTPLKWKYLLLLMQNYERYPTGKKVRTWLEKVH